MADSHLQKLDYFDLLSEPLLLIILNKLRDAESLCRLLLVSKRFAPLVPQVDSVFIHLNPHYQLEIHRSRFLQSKKPMNFFKSLVHKLIARPLRLNRGKKPDPCQNDVVFDISHWITSALMNFAGIGSIELKISGKGGKYGIIDNNLMMKWTAEFGKDLRRCVFIGGTSVKKTGKKSNEENSSISADYVEYTLIMADTVANVASRRHKLVMTMVNSCPNLKSAAITDAEKQGEIFMNSEQITELRDSITATEWENWIPRLLVTCWFARKLELPLSGYVVREATMVTVMPEARAAAGGDSDGASDWFEKEKVYGELAREIRRRKEEIMFLLSP